MRFASLGSGSQGNCLIVDAGDTRLLLDCGFSTRATIEKLARLGISPEEIDGVLVTHEHSDHIAGVFRFACRFGIPVYLTHGTYTAAPRGKTSLPECRLIDSHDAFCHREPGDSSLSGSARRPRTGAVCLLQRHAPPRRAYR